jgi:hypothetical protein
MITAINTTPATVTPQIKSTKKNQKIGLEVADNQ